MASRPSGYAWGFGNPTNDYDAEVSHAAADLFDVWRSGAKPGDQNTALTIVGNVSAPTNLMKSMLTAEATRLPIIKSDQVAVAEDAAPLVEWAYSTTKERNQQVIARFATRATFERTIQSNLTTVLADDYPRRWWTERVENGHRRALELRCDQAGGQKKFAFSGRSELGALVGATAPYTVATAGAVNIHAPYLGLRLSWGWALDPIRPPMSSIRYVASLVEKYKGHKTLDILMVEPGLTAAAIGLAWFLSASTIYTCNLDDYDIPLEQADVVVVNLPNVRSLALREAARQVATLVPPRTLLRDEVDAFWRHPAHDPGNHASDLIQVALDHLADDGLLVVLADVESGIHHQADQVLLEQKNIQKINLTPSGRPPQFSYTKPPWAPFGGLPATGRFVSAWMRLAG